jgi:hypothetical protein
MMVKRKNRKKPVRKDLITKSNTIKKLKVKFLEYFRELPNYDLACDKIGRHATRVHRWEEADTLFASQVDEARADWAMNQAKRVKDPSWLLERILKSHFSGRQELTGANGKDLPVPLGKNLLE